MGKSPETKLLNFTFLQIRSMDLNDQEVTACMSDQVPRYIYNK